MNRIKITVADSQALMRRALIYLLKEDQQFDVVAEAENTTELITILNETQTNIVLLDLESTSTEDQENLKTINRLYPSIKIIFLGLRSGRLNKIKNRNTYSYVNKNAEPEFLFETIYSLINPDLYFSKPTNDYPEKPKINALKNSSMEENSLNQKEKEILKYICDGKTNKEIASMFQLAPSTVDFHRTKIYGKTNSSNITDLFKYAIKSGLISLS